MNLLQLAVTHLSFLSVAAKFQHYEQLLASRFIENMTPEVFLDTDSKGSNKTNDNPSRTIGNIPGRNFLHKKQEIRKFHRSAHVLQQWLLHVP